MQRSLVTVGGAVRAASLWIARHRRTPAVVAGVAIGIAGWAVAHHFIATVGFTREVIAGFLVACVACFLAGRVAATRVRDDYGLASLCSAGWLVLMPFTLAGATSLLAATPIAWLLHEPIRIAVLACAACVVFGIPAAGVGFITQPLQKPRDRGAFLFAAGVGVLLEVLCLAPAVGIQVPLMLVCFATAISWFAALARGKHASEPSPSKADLVGATGSVSASERRSDRGTGGASGTRRRLALSNVLVSVSMLLIGVGCAVSGRSLTQLFPEAAYLVATGVATFLVGAAAGGALHRRLCRRFEEDALRRLGAMLAAFGLLAPLAAFPWLVSRHLDANAFVSSVPLMMSLRMATVAVAVLPLALGCGLIAARTPIPLVVVPIVAGLAAGGWAVPAFGVVPLALALAVALPMLHVAPLPTLIPRSRRRWAVASMCVIAFVATLTQAGNYDAHRAAQLLFSTEAFISHQRGVPEELLPFVSDRRLVATSEEACGTVTVWKSRGTSLSVHVNGVPIAATAERTGLSPLPAGDVMSVALPLILHESPGSLLILGDAARSATTTAAGFPLREIVCYEPSKLHVPAASILEDVRITVRGLEPRLAVIAESRTFDVIVSDPGPPAILSNGACFTREFYETAAARLKADGLFCQRLQYADFGIEPFRVIAATMQSVFGDTLTIEIGPGQYALLGVRPGQRVVREGLAERLQRPHVRRALASLGWDWCMPLNLLAVDQTGLNKLADEAHGLNTAANGCFAYSLPQEMMRWGPKSLELAEGTADRTTRLILSVTGEDRRDIVERIAEVAAQRELMVKYPDQPWAYRKEVRSQLVESPRSVIRPVSGEVQRVRHPDDQHRLDYFEALGKAIGQTSPNSLARLESFAEPYDPLVTYFLHHEIAPLYQKLDASGELTHRLYAAYFADPRDRSVRDVSRTLELIASHPNAIPDETMRYDQLNSLIEIMLRRWEARGMVEPRSPQVVMVDIDICLDAIETAVEEMDPLAASAGLSREEWGLRKSAIERTLTRPLRKYRTNLLPHLRTAKRKAEAQAQKAESDAQ